MLTPHRLVVCANGLEMVTTAPTYLANATSSYHIAASGAGVSSTGYRIWDTNVMPAITSGVLNAGQTLTLPLTNAFLPPAKFDSIINVIVNGHNYPIGVSNSPDNQGVYLSTQPSINKILYWTNLYANIFFSSAPSVSDYTWGAQALSSNVFNPIPLIVYFSEPTPNPVTITYTVTFVYYSFNSTPVTPFSVTTTVAAGVSQATIGTINLLNDLPYDQLGVWKVQITTNDSTYRSLLPFYHWGNGYIP